MRWVVAGGDRGALQRRTSCFVMFTLLLSGTCADVRMGSPRFAGRMAGGGGGALQRCPSYDVTLRI